jgi:hypothetical protein
VIGSPQFHELKALLMNKKLDFMLDLMLVHIARQNGDLPPPASAAGLATAKVVSMIGVSCRRVSVLISVTVKNIPSETEQL